MPASGSDKPKPSSPDVNPWKRAAIAAIAVASGIAVASVIVFFTGRPPEEKIGRVSAPGFNPKLAGGGLSSNQIGSAALLASVRSSESIGFQILQDGVDEGVIDDFKQVIPRRPWDTQFSINDGQLVLKLRNRNQFLLSYPAFLKTGTVDDLFTIASRYGFLSAESSAGLNDLTDRTTALVDTLVSRSLTIGVTESDLAAEATTLAAEWEAWINDNPESSGTDTARRFRDVVVIAGDLASNPDNSKIDDFNAALQRVGGE